MGGPIAELQSGPLPPMRLRPVNNESFVTAPYLGTGAVGGQSVVRLDKSIGRGFWHAFEYDSLPAFMRQHGLHRLGASTP